jgi:hypothetical protein
MFKLRPYSSAPNSLVCISPALGPMEAAGTATARAAGAALMARRVRVFGPVMDGPIVGRGLRSPTSQLNLGRLGQAASFCPVCDEL